MMDCTQIVEFFVSGEKYNWSEEKKGLIKSAFLIGYALLHIPGSFLGQKYGGKTVLNSGLFLTAFCMLLTPIALNIGNTCGLFVLRFFIGVGEALMYPALIYLLSCWIPDSERGRVSSIIFCGGHIGSFIYNIITGFVLQNIEEHATIFYIFGVVGITWNVAFHLLVYNTPSAHPRMSIEEREYLQSDVGDLIETKSFLQIPWTKMVTSSPVLALIIAQLGHDWGFYILASEMPNYLNRVLSLDNRDLAIYTTIPYSVISLVSLLCGVVCDYIVSRQLLTLTTVRRIFTSIGASTSAVFTFLIYYAEYDWVLAVIYFTLAMGCMSGFYTGAQANILDLSPNYSGALMGVVNGTGAFCGYLVPYLTELLTTSASYDEWAAVFWTSFVVMNVTSITYLKWGSAEVQSWNYNKDYDDWTQLACKSCFSPNVIKEDENEILKADVKLV